MSSAKIIAHRGASHDAPENTLAAVRLGWEQGADGVEIDAHLTRDGEVVAIHDPTLLRTTGRDANVDALTLAEIGGLDAGVWKGAAWRGERVPALRDVLAAVPAGKRLFIELKEAPGLVRALRQVIGQGPVEQERIVLISFDGPALSQARQALPKCRTLFLADTPAGEPGNLPALIRYCHAERFDGLDVSTGWPISAAMVGCLHAAKLDLHVWTVNDPARARQLVEAGVDSITTDRPAWLRSQLSLA